MNLNMTLLYQKMLIASSTITSLTWRSNARQMPSILGDNVWKLWLYPLQSRIINFKQPLAKLPTRLDLKLMIRILNPVIVLAVKAMR